MSKSNKLHYFTAIFIYCLSALFLIYEMALQVSPSIMTNQLMATFKIDARLLGIMVSFYFYSYTFMQIPVGVLYDRLGPRVLISLAAFICGVGSFLFGIANGFYIAALGRGFMGIGSAFAFVGVLVIIQRYFSAYYFALLVGISQLLAAFGAMGGELPLSVLVNRFGWRNVMVFSGFIGGIIALFSALIIRNHPTHKKICNPHSSHLIGDLKEIFHSSQTYWIALYAFSGWGPIVIFAVLWGVPYLMGKYAISNTHAAFGIAMIWLGLALTSPFIGWFSNYMGKRRPLLIYCSLIGVLSSIAIIYLPKIPFWMNLIFLFMMGCAASGQILSFALVKDNNRHFVFATATGFNNMAVVVGGIFLQPLVGYILHLLWSGKMEGNVPIYSLSSYAMGFLLIPSCFLIGLIISIFFIRETYCRPFSDTYI